MLSEINKIQEIVGTLSFSEIEKMDEKQRALGMTFINVGELARHLSSEFKKENKEIPVRDIVDFRNVIAHGYFSLNFLYVWDMIHTDLLDLKTAIVKLLKNS